MADFDNGLPSPNTSLTGKSVSDVNFVKAKFTEHDTKAVHSLCYQQTEAQQTTQFSVENIVFSCERVGTNYVFFML